MKPAFYRSARGEYVMTYPLFKCLDPDALAKGKLRIRAGIA